MAMSFLNQFDSEILLSVDTDVTFTIEDVDRVVERCTPSVPLVSGIYLRTVSKTMADWEPLVYQLAVEDPFVPNSRKTHLFKAMTTEEVSPGNGVIEAQAVGLGFMAYHRSFLEKILGECENGESPWGEFWLPSIEGTPRHVGEDLSFGLRLWRWGHKVTVDTEVQCGHFMSTAVAIPRPKKGEE